MRGTSAFVMFISELRVLDIRCRKGKGFGRNLRLQRGLSVDFLPTISSVEDLPTGIDTVQTFNSCTS